MSGVVTVARAELRLLTPLFMGGADQEEEVPELRAASLKSALRWWYRAADPRAVVAERRYDPRDEDVYFGGTGDDDRGGGQSPLLLRLASDARSFGWSDLKRSPGFLPFRSHRCGTSSSRRARAATCG